MTATPQHGDRIRVTGVQEGVLREDGLLLTDDGKTISFGSGPGVTVEILAPAESWEPGDVVRAADNPDDDRAWQYNPDAAEDVSPWEMIGNYSVELTKYLHRVDLPDQLTLIVRNGKIVLPEVSDDDVNVAWKEAEWIDDARASIRAGLIVYRARLMGGAR